MAGYGMNRIFTPYKNGQDLHRLINWYMDHPEIKRGHLRVLKDRKIRYTKEPKNGFYEVYQEANIYFGIFECCVGTREDYYTVTIEPNEGVIYIAIINMNEEIEGTKGRKFFADNGVFPSDIEETTFGVMTKLDILAGALASH